MSFSQRLKPGFKLIGDRLVSNFHAFNPRKLALQRRGEIDRRPTDQDKTFNEAGGRHSGTMVTRWQRLVGWKQQLMIIGYDSRPPIAMVPIVSDR